MTRYRIERGLVALAGFCLGASLAMCIAPGDVLLWVAAGVTLTLFAHAFFIRELGGELFWPGVRPHRGSASTPLGRLFSMHWRPAARPSLEVGPLHRRPWYHWEMKRPH